MDYRDLPYDAEIEYLHSPVGSYIVIPSNFNCEEFTRYVSHFQFQSNIRQQRLFNSSKRAIYENGSGLLAAAQNSDWVSSGLNWSTECIVDVDTHKRKTFFYDKSMALLRTTTHSSVGNAYYELLLFTSTDQTQNANVKCWDFKAYIDDDLVLDLIPVRIGNVGYLFDRVSGQLFGNAGTGSFVLGPDVAPGRYANEVAFLESWGNQYIDTGIKPSTDTKIELKCLYCKSGAGLTNYGALIGADDRDNAYILNHSAVANFTYGLEFSNNFANPQTRLLTFDSTASPQNMRVYDEGGSLVTTLTCLRGVFEVNQNLYLFAVNRGGTPVYGSNRILYCKIYDGDTLVRDYVPVEYDGIGYMYDKVSGLFFDNQGTGKFLFGSIAKACARSYTRRQLMLEEGRTYIQNGLVFHLDGINKGNDSTAWTDLKGGIKFAYTTHSILQSNGVKFDGAGAISSNSDNTVRWEVGTIEYVFTDRTGGGVLFAGVSNNYLYITVGNGGTCFHPRTNKNQYNYTMPTAAATVSLNNVRGIVNGNNVTARTTNNWDANPTHMSIGGKLVANYWYVKMVVHSIRIYNRQLSQEEMLYNQRIDNKRFNLGLNI